MADTEFSRALAAAYATFAAPKPGTIDGCPCCLDRKGVCTLLAKDLHELNSDELGPYAASVILTVGDLRDFRYFLPRLLEISATDFDWWPSEEVLLGKLCLASWRDWPKDEQAAIERVLWAWFIDMLGSGTDVGWRLDALICGLGRAGVDTAPYLEHLLAPVHVPALVDFHAKNAATLTKKGRLSNGFWDKHPAAAASVITFLQRPDVQAAVQRWYLGLPGQPPPPLT